MELGRNQQLPVLSWEDFLQQVFFPSIVKPHCMEQAIPWMGAEFFTIWPVRPEANCIGSGRLAVNIGIQQRPLNRLWRGVLRPGLKSPITPPQRRRSMD